MENIQDMSVLPGVEVQQIYPKVRPYNLQRNRKKPEQLHLKL